MSVALIGFISFCFVGLTLINRWLEGQLITAVDVSVLSNLTITMNIQIGAWTLPVPNVAFFTVGIPSLLRWDYSFFGGNAGIFMYFLYSVTAAVSFGLAVTVLGLLYNYFGRR